MTAEPAVPKRPRGLATMVLAAVDAVLAVAVPLAVLALLALVAWAVGGAAWATWTSAAGDLWLDGHGVRLAVAGSPGFAVGLAALGPALVTFAGGIRGGRRLAATAAPLAGAIVAVPIVAAAGAAVALAASSPAVRPVLWQAALAPAAWYAAGLLAGGGALGAALRAHPVLDAAVRTGAGTAVALLGGGALAVAVLLGAHLPAVVGVSEQLHAGGAGGLALTVAELALLPTLAVWAAAWLAGPGFALGAGTTAGPGGVHLGALPAIPVLGAIPSDVGGAGLAVLAVPVAAAAACGAVARRRAGLPGGAAIPVGLLAGAVAGGLLGVLGLLASGPAGPGRLAVVGPDPLLLAGAVALETALAGAIGFAVGRPVAHVLPPEHELPAAWRDLDPV